MRARKRVNKAVFHEHSFKTVAVFELPEERGKYTNKYIGIFMLDQG